MAVIRLFPPAPVPPLVVRKAARVIRKGGVLLYPTDTVYGLGCDALNPTSIQRVFDIKLRPETRPALVLVRDRAMLGTLVSDLPPLALKLMERFWPGPLTMVFNAREGLHPLLTGNAGKVGARLPDHEFCRRLLGLAGVPIVSTSANISDEEGVQEIDTLRLRFGGIVDLFIDAGPPASTVPSTVVDVTGGSLKVIREGVIPASALYAHVKLPPEA
jgi:L-threonylcarbamoyladenylate synthase